MKLKYSVVTINISGYEIVHEILEKSKNAEYILLTDDRSLKSDTWTIKYIDNEFPSDPFYTVFKLRYHIFDYINTDIAFMIDGSIQVKKNLDIFIQKMEENNSDCCLFLHNYNKTFAEEYYAWECLKDYSHKQTEKVKYLTGDKWFNDYKGLAARTILIQKNTENIKKWNNLTFEYCKLLKSNEETSKVDRLDQTIFSYIAQKYFENIINPIYVSLNILNNSEYFAWFIHNSYTPLFSSPSPQNIIFDYYFFNKKVEICKL